MVRRGAAKCAVRVLCDSGGGGTRFGGGRGFGRTASDESGVQTNPAGE